VNLLENLVELLINSWRILFVFFFAFSSLATKEGALGVDDLGTISYLGWTAGT